MANLDGYDANDHEPVSFDLIPDGQYEAVISASEMADTTTGGEMLKLTISIISGPHKNRLVWDNLNLKNKSEKAVEIAKGTLSSICRAVEVMTPKDSSELHNKPLLITVGHEDAVGKYKAKNKVKAYNKRPIGMVAAAMNTPSTDPPVDTPESGDIPF